MKRNMTMNSLISHDAQGEVPIHRGYLDGRRLLCSLLGPLLRVVRLAMWLRLDGWGFVILRFGGLCR